MKSKIAKQAPVPGAIARTIADLQLKEVFVIQGERYRLEGFDDDGAKATRLKTVEIGAATIHLPSNTEIE